VEAAEPAEAARTAEVAETSEVAETAEFANIIATAGTVETLESVDTVERTEPKESTEVAAASTPRTQQIFIDGDLVSFDELPSVVPDEQLFPSAHRRRSFIIVGLLTLAALVALGVYAMTRTL
jgi:7,8-dihydro-6-hydroxymethylpterin-pyrophosphokinase